MKNDLNKTTVYLTNEIKELLREAAYVSRLTKTQTVNDALKIGLCQIIKEFKK